jgi:hypothetical protein
MVVPSAEVWSLLPVLREKVRMRVISSVRQSLDVRNHPHPRPLPEYRARGRMRQPISRKYASTFSKSTVSSIGILSRS